MPSECQLYLVSDKGSAESLGLFGDFLRAMATSVMHSHGSQTPMWFRITEELIQLFGGSSWAGGTKI